MLFCTENKSVEIYKLFRLVKNEKMGLAGMKRTLLG